MTMNTNNPTLYVPALGNIVLPDVDTVINSLEENGVRQTIDSLGWKEKYPYHPLTTFSMAHSDTTLFIDFFCAQQLPARCQFQAQHSRL